MKETRETFYSLGETVRYIGADYKFMGVVVSVFNSRTGLVRYVVENADSVLKIFSAQELSLVS